MHGNNLNPPGNSMPGVGIFSGTFDPVHNGHLQFARDALKLANLEKVFFMVEPRPRRKQGVKAFEHRLRMVQLAVKDDPALGTIELYQDQFTPHETMPVLQARFKGADLYLLMGDDMLAHLGGWPHVDELIKSTHFIVGIRGEEEKALRYISTLEKTRGLNLRHYIFKSTYSGVSSSNVKTALRRHGVSPDLPQEVSEYIKTHKLYTADSGA